MGLVGPGVLGAHHVDAVRCLGFVDVIGVAASSQESARSKADALGIPNAYASFQELIADPAVHVIHNTTPNYLHGAVIHAAVAAGLGIGLSPLWQIHSLIDQGAVEIVLEEFEATRLPINAVWPSTRRLSMKARLFVDLLTARLRHERL